MDRVDLTQYVDEVMFRIPSTVSLAKRQAVTVHGLTGEVRKVQQLSGGICEVYIDLYEPMRVPDREVMLSA